MSSSRRTALLAVPRNIPNEASVAAVQPDQASCGHGAASTASGRKLCDAAAGACAARMRVRHVACKGWENGWEGRVAAAQTPLPRRGGGAPASDRERSACAAARKAGGRTRSQLFSVTDLRAEHPASAVAGTASSPPPPARLHDFKTTTCAATPVIVFHTLQNCTPQPERTSKDVGRVPHPRTEMKPNKVRLRNSPHCRRLLTEQI